MRPPAAHPLPPWLTASTQDALQLAVVVAAHPRRGRIVGASEGRLRLQLVVPPQDAFGNAALVAFLAERLKVSRAQMAVVVGHASWKKTVHLAGVGVLRCLLALTPQG